MCWKQWIYTIFFSCIFIPIFAQTGLEIQIEAAKGELDRIEAENSKEHIYYADQALILADLYFRSYASKKDGETDANALAKEALRFYRDSLGANSTQYFEALNILPADYANFHHLHMNLEDARMNNDQNLVFHLIELAELLIEDALDQATMYKLPTDAYKLEVYDLLLEAYQLLEKSAPNQLGDLFQRIPKSIVKLIKLHLKLVEVRKKPFVENDELVVEVELNNTAIVSSFENYMLQLERIYLDSQKEVNYNFYLLVFGGDQVYAGIRKLLNYYNEQDQKKYEDYFKKVNPQFQYFYEIEATFWEGIDQHKTTTEEFYKDFKVLLYEMEDGDLSAYVNYSVQELFNIILTDIQKFQPGSKENPYYQKVVEMQRLQRLNKSERFIATERIRLEKMRTENLHFSEDYIQSLIELAKVEYDEVKEEIAFKHFKEAIDIAIKMDQGKTAENEFSFNLGLDDDLDLNLDDDDDLDLNLDDEDLNFDLDDEESLDLNLDDDDLDLNLDDDDLDLNLDDDDLDLNTSDSIDLEKDSSKISLEEKYRAKVPEPWRQILLNEDAITYAWGDENATILTSLNAALFYFKVEVLEQRGEDYLKEALSRLKNTSSIRKEALEVVKQIALLEWENNHKLDYLYEYKDIILKSFNREELEPFVQKVFRMVEMHYGSQEKNYAEVLSLVADIHYLDNDPQSNVYALELYEEALNIYMRNEGKYNSYYFLLKSLISKALEAENDWPVETMAAFFDERLQIAKEIDLDFGELDWNYFEALDDYIQWHYGMNRYVSAEAKIKELLLVLETQEDQAKAIYGYDEALHQLARVYRKTGRYNQSLTYYKKAIPQAAEFGNYSLLIEALDGLGLLLQDVGEYDEAFKAFDQCLSYFELYEAEGKINSGKEFKDALNFIKILRHIGRLHLDIGEYDQAMELYQKVMNFEKASSLVGFKYDYSLQRDLGLYYDYIFEDEKSEFYYKKAIRNFEKSNDLGDLADTHIKIADFYIRRNRDSLARPHFLKALEIDLERLKQNYTNLAEAERLLFLNTLMPRIKAFYSFVARQQDPVLIEKMLNTHLEIKGLALENTTNVRSVVYASENVELKNIYAEMQSLRQVVASATALTEAERKKREINLEVLNQEIKEKEEELSQESKVLQEIFKRENKQINFSELQKLMDSSSVAIDFSIIEEKLLDGEIKEYYYAFLIRPQDSFPKLIRLCAAEDLNFALEAEVQPNGINYITDASESNYIYRLVWAAIEKELEGVKGVHICPTGVMAKIAFATLHIDDFSHQRLMDLYQIYYHTALRDLLERPVQEGASMSINPDIMLVGGVRFSMNAYELKQALEFTPTLVDTSELDHYGKAELEQLAVSETFNYLPGTLKEISKIKSVFEDYRWNIRYVEGVNTLEESIRRRIRKKAPIVLHIATHGFFFPERQETLNLKASNKVKLETIEDRLAKEQNPLLRSGLALAGINHIWRGGQPISGLDDGIFTAYEVANLNLFNTELVVLSACETGQGDINNNEGVIGLQRAFKMAGARRLIISLWKVPDNQTSELMSLFYQNFLKANMEIHEAFEAAQHEMRRRYPNAYYWAAFILVE